MTRADLLGGRSGARILTVARGAGRPPSTQSRSSDESTGPNPVVPAYSIDSSRNSPMQFFAY